MQNMNSFRVSGRDLPTEIASSSDENRIRDHLEQVKAVNVERVPNQANIGVELGPECIKMLSGPLDSVQGLYVMTASIFTTLRRMHCILIVLLNRCNKLRVDWLAL